MWPFTKKKKFIKPARNYFPGTVYRLPPTNSHNATYCCILDDLWYYYILNSSWSVVPPELQDLKLEGGNWQQFDDLERLPEDSVMLEEIDLDSLTSLVEIGGDILGAGAYETINVNDALIEQLEIDAHEAAADAMAEKAYYSEISNEGTSNNYVEDHPALDSPSTYDSGSSDCGGCDCGGGGCD